MSGGVDSSVAAALMLAAGADVVGITMRLRAPVSPETGALSPAEQDARRVAQCLGIEHHIIDLSGDFEGEVISPFVRDYAAGLTPSPCARCNPRIKFGRLLHAAASLRACRLATGHYARIELPGSRALLRRAADPARDQSYFLFGLSQRQLAAALFPLGNYTKTQVRSIARELGLPVAGKSDSQEICFIPNNDYVSFVETHPAFTAERAGSAGHASADAPECGEIVTTGGRILGRHPGVHRFTVGQRRGLNVAIGEPLYVIATDAALRRVIVGRNDELLRKSFRFRDANWIAFERPPAEFRAAVKIRNKHSAAPAVVRGNEVTFDEPQRAVTPGQAAVFYDGDLVLGGGWIER